MSWPSPIVWLLSGLMLLVVSGCSTFGAKPFRETRFINMDAEVLRAQYFKETRTETLPNGLVSTFDNALSITLPTGKRIKLYQSFSPFGVRYISSNRRYEFFERGVYCLLYLDGAAIFEGVHCRD